MTVWVLYDISSARAQRHITKLLFDAGLQRIQKSVFGGSLQGLTVAELKSELAPWVESEDSLFIVPFTAAATASVKVLGNPLCRLAQSPPPALCVV